MVRARRLLCRRGGETEIEKFRRRPFTPAVLVIAQHHELLRQLGLDTMDGVKQFNGELIKNHKGRRDIYRIHASAGPDGQPVVLFLKRNWQPYKKDGLSSLLTRGRVWSQSAHSPHGTCNQSPPRRVRCTSSCMACGARRWA